MAKEKKDEKKKVKRPTAVKRDIQNKKRRLINRAFKSQMRTAVRHFEETVEKKDAAAAQTSLNTVYSLLDKGIKTGNVKRNTASRTKSRLTARAAALNASK